MMTKKKYQGICLLIGIVAIVNSHEFLTNLGEGVHNTDIYGRYFLDGVFADKSEEIPINFESAQCFKVDISIDDRQVIKIEFEYFDGEKNEIMKSNDEYVLHPIDETTLLRNTDYISSAKSYNGNHNLQIAALDKSCGKLFLKRQDSKIAYGLSRTPSVLLNTELLIEEADRLDLSMQNFIPIINYDCE